MKGKMVCGKTYKVYFIFFPTYFITMSEIVEGLARMKIVPHFELKFKYNFISVL